MAYLFTHFKEKYTPDGEQVYFGISRDGHNWEQVNNGNPILTAELGEKGCRDRFSDPEHVCSQQQKNQKAILLRLKV